MLPYGDANYRHAIKIHREAAYMMDWVFVLITAFIAYHGLTFRDASGEREWVHLLFGCIALLFCLRVLFVDIFKLVTF